MTPNGIPAPCGNSSIQVNSTFQEPDLYKCDKTPYFCDAQLYPKYIWDIIVDPVTGIHIYIYVYVYIYVFIFIYLKLIHMCLYSYT
jgi:hypothetical protein